MAERVGSVADRPPIQERKRLIAERDHRLEVMSSQFDQLKRIELVSKERRRPVRPSATVTP